MTKDDDFIIINDTIKLKCDTNNIQVYVNDVLLTRYKKTFNYENDRIKKINENYKLNNTTVKIIELTSGTIVQIGKYGFSIYNSISDFLKQTEKKYIKTHSNFFFQPY